MSLKEFILVRDCPALKGPAEKAIMFAVASRIGGIGYAWPAEETIAKDSGTSLRSVKRHLAILRRNGLLHRFKSPGIRSWCYKLGPAIYAQSEVPTATIETGQQGIEFVPNRPSKGANLTPKDKKEVLHAKAKGRRTPFRPGIDYSSSELPTIADYMDIGHHDPILVAMAITRERAKTGWGHWVKRLRQACYKYGEEVGTREFRVCLHDLFGLSKEPHQCPLGAILNRLLQEKFGDLAVKHQSAA